MATMDVLIAIVLNLVSALLGFWIGWLWQFLKKTLQYRRARYFWKPFIVGELQVVVGRFFEFASFEPSGFLGVGDAIGLTELRAYFVKLGLHDFTVSYADQLNGEALKTNLILIGGPDANVISKEALARIPSKLRFGDPTQHVVAINDSLTGRIIAPLTGEDLEEISIDYGVIIKTSNPFAPDKQLLLIAGSFGFGTWAGIRFSMSKKFIKNATRMKNKSIECLIEVDVVRKTPQDIRQVLLREIEEASRQVSHT